jgi:sodium-dependent phosphate transporter
MVGMIWLLVATYMEFPVSTTHDIVAAYLGWSIAANGFESIKWKTTGLIFVSWFASPIFAGLLAGFFFKVLLEAVLKVQVNTFDRALVAYPVVVFVAITANIFFVMSKSAGNNVDMDEEDWNRKVVLPASLGGGTLCAVFTWLFVCPWLKLKVTREHNEREEKASHVRKTLHALEASNFGDDNNEEDNENENTVGEEKPRPELDVKEQATSMEHEVHEPTTAEVNKNKGFLERGYNSFLDNTIRQDLHGQSMSESRRASEIWQTYTEYDDKTEHLFQYLQVFTACLASFAHGSNDVANAIAPVSGVLQIWRDGEFVDKAGVPKWLLAMGGFAIGLGFLLFGYRIIKAVGFKLTAISPARGFCIELGAALAVSLASFMMIPVSTTQCLVGATCGVGLASGGTKNVEWLFLLRTMCGWVGIFFVVAIVSAGFFAFCVFSPSL